MLKLVIVAVLLLLAACVNANVKKCDNANCCKQAKTASVKLRAVQSSLVKFNKQVSTHSHSVTVTGIVNAVTPLIKASSSVIALQSPVELQVVNHTLRKTLKSMMSLGTTLLKKRYNKNKVKTLARMLHNLNGLPKINNAVSTANILLSGCNKSQPPPRLQNPPPPSTILPPSCYDGIKNGNENGVDCGGSCAFSCANIVPCTYPSELPTIDYYPNFVNTSRPFAQVTYSNLCGILSMIPRNAYNNLYPSHSIELKFYGSYEFTTSIRYNIPQPGTGYVHWDFTVSPARVTVYTNGSVIYQSTVSRRRNLLYTKNVYTRLPEHTASSRALLQTTCNTNAECHNNCDNVELITYTFCGVFGAGFALGGPVGIVTTVGIGITCAYYSPRVVSICNSNCDTKFTTSGCASPPKYGDPALCGYGPEWSGCLDPDCNALLCCIIAEQCAIVGSQCSSNTCAICASEC